MLQVSKRKQHLAKIAPLVVESNKHCKATTEVERDERFKIRQKLDDNFWDEYKSDLTRDLSSDESSSEEEKGEEEDKDPDGKKGTYKFIKLLSVFTLGAGNTPGAGDFGDYLRAIQGTGSLSTEKRKRLWKQALEKAALGCQSIVAMFTAQPSKVSEVNLLGVQNLPFIPSISKGKISEINKEIKVKAAHNLSELMRLKTKQIKKLGTVLDPQSNLYQRHQMVQSFFWMQSRQNTDNPGVKRHDLATMIAQRFNKGQYTGCCIINWEKEWIDTGKISDTKAERHKHALF